MEKPISKIRNKGKALHFPSERPLFCLIYPGWFPARVSKFHFVLRIRGRLKLGDYLTNLDAFNRMMWWLQLTDIDIPGKVLETSEAVSQPSSWQSCRWGGNVLQQPKLARSESWSRRSSFGSATYLQCEQIPSTSSPPFFYLWNEGWVHPCWKLHSWDGPSLSCEPPDFPDASMKCEETQQLAS